MLDICRLPPKPPLWININTSQISFFKRPQPTLSSKHTHTCKRHTYRPQKQGELFTETPTHRHTLTRLSHLPTFSSSISQFLSSCRSHPRLQFVATGDARQRHLRVESSVCLCVSVCTTQKQEMRVSARVTMRAPDVCESGGTELKSQVLNFWYCETLPYATKPQKKLRRSYTRDGGKLLILTECVIGHAQCKQRAKYFSCSVPACAAGTSHYYSQGSNPSEATGHECS